jgi:hypothetical protein
LSTILDIFRASGGGDCIIPTLELTCTAWSEPIFICAGFANLQAIDENGRPITFLAAGLDVSLPKKNNDGGQSLGVAIDNVTGEAQAKIDLAKETGARIMMIYRTFLESDTSHPAEPPMRMTALSASMEGATVRTIGGYYDLINSAWPRFRYTAGWAPGIKYIA